MGTCAQSNDRSGFMNVRGFLKLLSNYLPFQEEFSSKDLPTIASNIYNNSDN